MSSEKVKIINSKGKIGRTLITLWYDRELLVMLPMSLIEAGMYPDKLPK